MKLYGVNATEEFIYKYIASGGTAYQLTDSVVALGNWILTDPNKKLKSVVIKERVLNEWSSAQTIRCYNELPKKYQSMIDSGEYLRESIGI